MVHSMTDEQLRSVRSEIGHDAEVYAMADELLALRAERDAARALLRLAFQALLISRLDYDLRIRIAKELGDDT